jgi:hypothetical protein
MTYSEGALPERYQKKGPDFSGPAGIKKGQKNNPIRNYLLDLPASPERAFFFSLAVKDLNRFKAVSVATFCMTPTVMASVTSFKIMSA